MLICLLYKVIIIIKAFHVVFCQKVELECILFQLISFFKFMFSCFEIMLFKIFIDVN